MENRGLKARHARHSVSCPCCGSAMHQERYAKDFQVWGCAQCAKTFYRQHGKRWVELAIPYADFFQEVEA